VSRFRWIAAGRTGARAGVMALVVAVATGSYFMVAALAAPAIPAPVITGAPHDPTASTSATFTYTDSQPGVSFLCSLDGRGFALCPAAGIRYLGLHSGDHSFAVEASRGVSVSSPTTYSWQVDTTRPVVSVTFPRTGTDSPAQWSAGCSPPGVCGTASDPIGLQFVAVAIYQWSSRKFWTGTAFASSSAVYNQAVGTTNWRYGFTPPQPGEYTVLVQATDPARNTTFSQTVFSYRVPTLPAPVITKAPRNPTMATGAEFRFTDADWPLVRFWCSLDSGPTRPCTSDWLDPWVEGRIRYRHLASGQHCFSVYVTDWAGHSSPATKYCWTIGTTGQNFTVGGDLTTPLYPGTSEPLDLTFTNPNSAPITIPAGGVGPANITFATNNPGCAGSNFEVSQALTVSVTVPAGQTTPISLSELGVSPADWPVITMINTNSNQDACEGATVTLTYSGIEATG
jgi:hypothetical protein